MPAPNAAQGALMSGLSGRYAVALFEVAEEQSALAEVMSDMDGLDALLRDSDDLARLVRDPRLGRTAQTRAVTALADAAKLQPATRKFLGVLAQNRRLSQLALVIRDFRRLLSLHKGEVAAEVTSATALSDGHRSQLSKQLKLATGSDVLIEEKVDPAILGGLIVRVGSRMIDASLATKLQMLETQMKGA